MKINGSQLFFREIGGTFTENNVYLICGLVKVDQSYTVKDGSLLSLGECYPLIIDEEDRKDYAKGMGLDNIMQSPIWRLK